MAEVDKRLQVAAQCRAIVHLATTLALIHSDKAEAFAGGNFPAILEGSGKRSAAIMEILGDILNGMDAVTEDDEWMDPIFERAHQLWPQGQACPHCGCVPTPEATDADAG